MFSKLFSANLSSLPKPISIIIIIILSAIAFLLLNKAYHVPMGVFWWDILTFDGTVAAMKQGLYPGIDFSSTMILPHYILYLASLVSEANNYLMSHWVFWIGFFPLAAFGLYNRLSNRQFLAWLVFFFIFSLAPFNYSFVGERSGEISGNGFYNRWGSLLLCFSFLMNGLPIKNNVARHRVANTLVLTMILLISFYLKFPIFLCSLVLIVASPFLHQERRYWPVALASLVLFLIATAFIDIVFGFTKDYLDTINYISDIRHKAYSLHLRFRLRKTFHQHWIEFLLLTILMSFVLNLYRYKYLKEKKFIDLHILYAVITIIMALAYTYTNYGDLGLLPICGSIFLLREYYKHQKNHHPKLESTSTSKNNSLSYFFNADVVKTLSIFLTLSITPYFFNVLYSSWKLTLHSIKGQYEKIDISRTGYINQIYIKKRHKLAYKTLSETQKQSPNLRSVSGQYNWLLAFMAAANELERLGVPKSDKIYALTFPAYAFGVLGYQIPKNSKPWMLAPHNLTHEIFPPLKEVIGNAEHIAVEHCSMHKYNQETLYKLYGKDLTNNFYQIKLTNCWTLYSKTHQQFYSQRKKFSSI